MESLLYIPQYKQTVLNVPGGITDVQTTGIILSNTDGVDITKPGLICITYADPVVTTDAEFITFTSIDSNKELQGVTRGAEGIAGKAHLNNAQVAFVVSKSHINLINDKLTGVDTTVITDTAGNELLKVAQVSSAVNHIGIKNAATGNGPEVQALGDNTNIDLILSPKGTGGVGIYVPTGNDATLKALGADTDVDLSLTPKGAGKTNVTANDLNLATGANVQVNDVDPWRTVSIFGGMKPCTTAGCAASVTVEAGTNDIDYNVLDFDTGTDENAFVNFQMPDSWDGGVIQFRYVWTNAGGGANETLTFELSGRAFADSDAIDQAVGTAIEVADTWLAQGDIHLSAWSGDVTVAGTTPAGGQWVHFEIMRDVSEDNLTGDARLMGVEIRYKQKQFSD